jgi:hypothetical protein
MNILIMVLTYTKPPYDSLLAAQYDTWDSVDIPGVQTIYYHGGLPEGGLNFSLVHHSSWIQWRKRIELQCTDEYYFMAAKFKKALEWTKQQKIEYDIIFRTNSSSYVNKEKLLKALSGFPKEKLYAGWTFEDLNDFSGLCVSGAGIFLSRDTADILRKEIDVNMEMEEDVYIGRILRKHGITAIDDKSRVDYPADDSDLLNAYHIRFKRNDRVQDARNMIDAHNKIINNHGQDRIH